MAKLTLEQQVALNKIIAEEILDTEADADTILKRVCKRFDDEVLGEDKIAFYNSQPIKELIQQKLVEFKAAMV